MIIINDFIQAKKRISDELINSQLDSYHVYSLEIRLNFLMSVKNCLINKRLVITSKVHFIDHHGITKEKEQVIGKIHRLIGREVKEIFIEPNGDLLISCNTEKLLVFGQDGLYEAWSVSCDYDNIYERDWFVSYTEDRELVVSCGDSDKEVNAV